MQQLTFELMGVRTPTTELDSEIVRTRMSAIGYLDPSIILKTDNTVNVTIDKNIYTISTNLQILVEENIVSTSSTITLVQQNLGIQEVLVNLDTELDPAFGEIVNYTVIDNIITLESTDYNGKSAYIKYLTTK